MAAMLLVRLLGAGNLGETAVKFQWCSAIARFGRVCVQDEVMIIIGVRLRVELYSLVLESIIGGRANNTVMDHMSGIFGKDFESHGIPDVGNNANPPACFLFGRRERLIRVEVENVRKICIRGKQRCLAVHHVEVCMGSDN